MGDGSMADLIDGAAVVVCCGSGGVGKTTTAAVIGREAARRGRRVVVVTIDPARRLADALGLGDRLDGTPRRVALAGDGGHGDGGHVDGGHGDGGHGDGGHGDGGPADEGELWAMMLDTAEMFAAVIRENAPDADQAERIIDNRFAQTIATSLGGTEDYMATEALYRLHGDERFDLVVVDTAPSRQALDFLEAPGVLARFLDHRVFRMMMMPTRRGLKILNTAAQPVLRAIGKVVGGDVLADAVTFFQAFAGMEAGFRERARRVEALLREPSTAFVLVASPRHDTVTEALWFAERLDGHRLAAAAVIVNRVHPSTGPIDLARAERAAEAAQAAGDVTLMALWSAAARSARLVAAERTEIERLAASASMIVEIPLLGTDVHDPVGLDLLGAHLVPDT